MNALRKKTKPPRREPEVRRRLVFVVDEWDGQTVRKVEIPPCSRLPKISRPPDPLIETSKGRSKSEAPSHKRRRTEPELNGSFIRSKKPSKAAAKAASAEPEINAKEEVRNLSSGNKAVKELAAESLIMYADEAEKAREVVFLVRNLSSNAYVEKVRNHCARILGEGLSKLKRPGEK